MVIGPWVSASAERALDLARRASELAGMAFEIAFDKAGETLEPSGKALKPSRGGASDPAGKRGRDEVRQ